MAKGVQQVKHPSQS